MSTVLTIDGLVDRKELRVKDIVDESATARVVSTEWYREGRVVRRDVFVNVLAPQVAGVTTHGQ